MTWDKFIVHMIIFLVVLVISLTLLSIIDTDYKKAKESITEGQAIIEMLPKIVRVEDDVTASLFCSSGKYEITVNAFDVISGSDQEIITALKYPGFGPRVRSGNTVYKIEKPRSSISTTTYTIRSDKPPVILKFAHDITANLQHGQKIIADPLSFELSLYDLPFLGCSAAVFTKCGVESGEMHFRSEDLEDNINICGASLGANMEIHDCLNADLTVKLYGTPKPALGFYKGEELQLSFWKKPTEDTKDCWKTDLTSITSVCKDEFLGGVSVYVPIGQYHACS